MSAASLSISISMAATTTTSSSSSYSLLNKVSNLSFTHSHIPISTHFHPKPIAPKPLRLNTQFSNFDSFSFLSHPHLCRASSTFDFKFSQEEEEEVKKDSDSGGVGRLYVGNLPFSMTAAQLTEIFAEAGSVVSIEVVYDRITDRSRGFAFVTMGSVEEAKEAIRLFDRAQVGGRTVKVNFPEVPMGGEREVMRPKVRSSYQGFVDTPYKIYAGNLGWSITADGLRDIFADQQGVLSAKVVYEGDTGRSRGFGFVSFESAEAAQSALNSMNGVEVEGRPLRLSVAKERANRAPPAVERNTEENGSSELFSGMST